MSEGAPKDVAKKEGNYLEGMNGQGLVQKIKENLYTIRDFDDESKNTLVGGERADQLKIRNAASNELIQIANEIDRRSAK